MATTSQDRQTKKSRTDVKGHSKNLFLFASRVSSQRMVRRNSEPRLSDARMNRKESAAVAKAVLLRIGVMQNGRCSAVSHGSEVPSRSRVMWP